MVREDLRFAASSSAVGCAGLAAAVSKKESVLAPELVFVPQGSKLKSAFADLAAVVAENTLLFAFVSEVTARPLLAVGGANFGATMWLGLLLSDAVAKSDEVLPVTFEGLLPHGSKVSS